MRYISNREPPHQGTKGMRRSIENEKIRIKRNKEILERKKDIENRTKKVDELKHYGVKGMKWDKSKIKNYPIFYEQYLKRNNASASTKAKTETGWLTPSGAGVTTKVEEKTKAKGAKAKGKSKGKAKGGKKQATVDAQYIKDNRFSDAIKGRLSVAKQKSRMNRAKQIQTNPALAARVKAFLISKLYG
jgi:hypothetical protein